MRDAGTEIGALRRARMGKREAARERTRDGRSGARLCLHVLLVLLLKLLLSLQVKEARRAEEVLDLLDFDVCEEVRKSRSRSKKNHSKFRLIQSHRRGGARVNSVVFLALSPEEKESWIQVLNQALNRAKNRVLDQVTVEDSSLSHLTRDRAKILHTRRLPTRGHLLAVASASSDGALTLDLIQEDQTRDQHPDQTRPKFKSPTETSEKPHTLPRQVVSTRKSLSSEKSLSLDQIPQNSRAEGAVFEDGQQH
uniref:PH domain-containing protein n=1 Tax=Knipowitschia caucasica TaxID=637954 RepID=A0AAV2MEC6_KNICA